MKQIKEAEEEAARLAAEKAGEPADPEAEALIDVEHP